MRRGRLIALAAVLLYALGASAPVASGAGSPQQVHDASVVQDGLQLVWQFRLEQPFSPSAMKREGRTLCLVIRPQSGTAVIGTLCLAPPRSGQRSPRLLFSVRGTGPPRQINAGISRSSTSSLTARFLPSAVGLTYKSFRWQILTTLAGPACTNPAGCKLLFPARPSLARLHTPQVVGCVPSGPSLVFHGPSTRRVIALTFDDGPWTQTAQFLSVLEREHVRATFFQIGRQIGDFGSALERRMLADGDMIGDHTWSHPNVSRDGTFAASQIAMAANAIRQATGGFRPCLFRAPGGNIGSALVAEARRMGFTTIQWDIDPRDWALPGANEIYGDVVSHARPGAIVLQHDGGGNRSQTLAALPREIGTLRHRGYQFVTVTDLLGQRLIYK